MLTREELALIARAEIARNRTVEHFMERIMRDQSPADAAQQLRLIAAEDHDTPASVNLLSFYAGMKAALSDADFRGITDGAGLPAAVRPATRRQRYKQFAQYRALFLLELKIARRLSREAMAVDEDWSGLGSYLRRGSALIGPVIGLYWAGFSYRLGIPGAMNRCDAAATYMMRTALMPG